MRDNTASKETKALKRLKKESTVTAQRKEARLPAMPNKFSKFKE